MASPEEQARENIDRMLTKSGWAVRDQNDAHISAYRGLAIRNFTIYHLWRQVLEYFDGYIIGLTATPNKQTFGFSNQNLVMEYGHEQAVGTTLHERPSKDATSA